MAKEKVAQRSKSGSKSIPRTKMAKEISRPPKNPHIKLLARKPDHETVVGSVSRKLTAVMLGGNWNDGGR
jgi:hypothetical protein